MIYFSERYRSAQQEIMDSTEFKGREMKNLLLDLKTVNKFLGGNNGIIKGLDKLLKERKKNGPLTIMDVGCGDGELLRKCHDFGQSRNYSFNFIGIDFNENMLKVAQQRSENYANISFQKVDVILNKELIPNCDIAVCGLFLHHLSENEIEALLKVLLKRTTIGLVINDLQRSRLAFNLFKIFNKLFLTTKTAEHDGLVSIARGFKKQEIINISRNIPGQQSEIHWRWAFRYQWIIKKTV